MLSRSSDASVWTVLPPCGEIMSFTGSFLHQIAWQIRLATAQLNYMLPVILRTSGAQTGQKHCEHAILMNVRATKTSALCPHTSGSARLIVFRCGSHRAFFDTVNTSAAKTQFHLMSLPSAPPVTHLNASFYASAMSKHIRACFNPKHICLN